MNKDLPRPERNLTDQSLDLERKKTDSALSVQVHTIELAADAHLRASRDALDQALLDDRAESDSFLEPHEQASEHVLEERRRVDLRISDQRLLADQTTREERSETKAEKGLFLTSERQLTDHNLSRERQEIDQAYALSGDLLAQEQAAHGLTKDAVAKRDEALAIIGHDLQDPLVIIDLCSEEFLGSVGNQRLTAVEVQWVETVRRHAKQMFRLVSDLLDVEYISAGKLPVAASPCCITTAVREMVASFQLLAARQNLRLVADLPNDSFYALADLERFRQVLANLISNALKFTPESGVISVQLSADEDTVRVAVVDSGPGIAPADHLRVFERYAQLGHKDRRGVGLGLFISKWLVEAQGGKIWVESNEGMGSTFYFSLLRSDPPLQPSVPTEGLARGPGAYRRSRLK